MAIAIESVLAHQKSKSKVKLNFGLSPLKVLPSERLSERLSQKLKWPIVYDSVTVLYMT